MSTGVERRDFLRLAGAGAAGAALGGGLPSIFGGTSAEAAARKPFKGSRMIDHPATEAGIDTIVVLMMENRSFDHFFGWLSRDEDYNEAGRSRYGRRFRVDGDQTQAFRDPEGVLRETYYLPTAAGEDNPYRGCGHPDPGHGWESGRVQRDRGFLANGSGNDPFALGYYDDRDVPVYADLARRFTVFDRFHCSVLGPTFPNREYLHSAQSGGHKANDFPVDTLGFQWDTIWDRLSAANVPAAYYFVDLPVIALWGGRMLPFIRPLEAFFLDCLAGTLPRVVFVDPGFTTGLRTDDHPHADMRAGQKLVFDIFKAFAESPQWNSGAFFLTYDEWGGFFDHVPPPLLPDDRSSTVDLQNFGQAGFRVPTVMASPYARPGFADHRLYDHTSILRFIEWRFLGAPPEGSNGSGWWLTQRDRYAANIGHSLLASGPNPDVDVDALPQLPIASLPCEGDELSGIPGAGDIPGLGNVPALGEIPVVGDKHSFEIGLEEGAFERLGYPIDLRPLPV